MTNVFSAKIFLFVLCLLCCDLPGHAADISISSAKLLPDSTDTSITLSSKVVTYAAADYFYIEEDTRNMGIRIDKVAHGLTVGMRADITGTMTTTADNERAVLASIATQTPEPNATGVIAPVSMNNLTLGGADWQVSGTGGQKGTSASTDLNNIGLLVKTWGRYQQVDATHFTIDDGSGLDIRCSIAPGTTLSSAWEKVIVTGISSVYKSNSATYLPMVLVRDIQVNLPITCSTEMIYIPGGSFQMGNNGSEPYSYPDELPQHSVYLSGYWIGKYEVTRGEYRAFMKATGRPAPRYWDAVQTWQTGQTFTQTENHPVVGVTWDDAQAYCAWAGGRLPTEAEWEKAARWTGIYSNVYPWGNTWDAEKCNNYSDYNFAGGGYGRFETSPVGSYPSGSSPYGCQDMAGNVWEWCADWYKSYPGSTSPFDYTDSDRVLRGGSWNNSDSYYRTASRIGSSPGSAWYFYWYGFRMAR